MLNKSASKYSTTSETKVKKKKKALVPIIFSKKDKSLLPCSLTKNWCQTVCFQENQCNLHDHINAKTLKKVLKKGAEPILNKTFTLFIPI